MKNKKIIRVKKLQINLKTATQEEINRYMLDFAKSYKPSKKNDLVSYIRRERGHRG
jgi:siroheme synthase